MDIQITTQRQAYFDARGKVILNACPGSGKTTCIVYKLSLIETECFEQFGSHAGIACLSFTNVAKNEILDKYKRSYGQELRYPHLAATIDSFINQFITLPFFNLLNKDFKRPKIVDDDSIIDNAFKTKYQQNGKWYDGIIKPLNTYKNRQGLAIYRSYPPSSIWIDANGNFSYEGKMPDTTKVDAVVFQAYGKAVFQAKLKKGLITSLDSAYIALCIINKYERVGKWLARRFPFIIIDESQDNSEVQHTIFEKLTTLGLTNIEMIGDPYQSLYEWRDAKPQLFLQKFTDTGWTGLPLSQNRRSVQRIINCFSIVRTPTDDAITSIDVEDLAIKVRVYKYTATNPSQIVQHFEETCKNNNFNSNHIVVRGNTLKDQMLGNTADIDLWKNSYPSRLLKIRHHFECNKIKDAVNELRRFILELLNPGAEYSTIKDQLQEIENDCAFNGKLFSFLYAIPSTSLSFQDWTTLAIAKLKEVFGIDAAASFEFKQKMNGYKMADLKMKNVNLYFNKSASAKYNIPITTIHQVKGATLDAILYFFNEDSIGQSVSFKDFKQSTTFPSEKQRMIYVACSRPKQFLAMAFPDKITDTDLKERFGNEIEIMRL
jgi:superfamily I DNA/RNA helicase